MSDLTARRLTHQLEALQSVSGPLARYLATLHRSLQDAGFSAEESLRLVAEMEAAMVRDLLGTAPPVIAPTLRVDMGGPGGR